MGYYDTAQICQNGHKINSSFTEYPQFNQKFCSDCGAKTITTCQSCNTKIRGYYSDSIVIAPYVVPSYCHECGAAYPWTSGILEAANLLAEEFDELDEAEIEKLKGTLPDLIHNTPKTKVAETRFKKIMRKVGIESYSAMRELLVDVTSEAIKKSLFPD